MTTATLANPESMHTCEAHSDTVTAGKLSGNRSTTGHPTSQKKRIRGNTEEMHPDQRISSIILGVSVHEEEHPDQRISSVILGVSVHEEEHPDQG